MRERDVDLSIVIRGAGTAFQHSSNIFKRLLRLAHIRLLRRQHHLQIAAARQFAHGFFGGVSGLLPFLGFAPGIDDLLISALDIFVAAEGHNLPEGLDGRLIISLIAIDRAQPLQENGPIALFSVGVSAIGLLRFLQQVAHDRNRFVKATLCLIDRGNVVGNFNRILHHGFGFFQIFKREIELALLAVNLRDANIRLRIFRIRVRDYLVLIESSVGLTIIQQILCEASNGVEVIAIHFNRVTIGINGFFILLLLLVGIAECRIKLGRALRTRHRTEHLRCASRIT